MTDKPISEMSFEEALDALGKIVDELERGTVPLEQSIALYERGDALKKHCEAKLDEAQLKVDRIVAGSNGKPAGTTDFTSE